MPRQLDKTEVKQLLRNPGNKVFRNQMMHIGWWIAIFLPLSVCFIIDFFASMAALIILIVNVSSVAIYVLVCRRHVIALTREGVYLSHVDTEDYRGTLSRRNCFVRWDELTQLKVANDPVMTFRVKGERYSYSVVDPIVTNYARAKKHQTFVEAICSYSGYIYHFQKGEGRTWQYLFASPGHTFDVEADASDWELNNV